MTESTHLALYADAGLAAVAAVTFVIVAATTWNQSRRISLVEWDVERIRVRGVPVPRELVRNLLSRFGAPVGQGTAMQIPTPASVTGLRVSPSGMVIYGRGRGGL